jgi:hypothetical protein
VEVKTLQRVTCAGSFILPQGCRNFKGAEKRCPSRVGMKSYAGVGSRSAPDHVLKLMERIGFRLAELGWILRTGGAEGADQAFERGAQAGKGAVGVFLPWPGYNGYDEAVLTAPTQEALELAASLHPAWGGLSQGVRKLMARNSHQVLGTHLDSPVAFVICWTPDGAEHERECGPTTGGTGQAVRLASRRGIPVVNLNKPGALERIAALVQE